MCVLSFLCASFPSVGSEWEGLFVCTVGVFFEFSVCVRLCSSFSLCSPLFPSTHGHMHGWTDKAGWAVKSSSLLVTGGTTEGRIFDFYYFFDQGLLSGNEWYMNWEWDWYCDW